MSTPNVCVLKTDGVNCDYEMLHAFDVAGAQTELVHVNQLRSGERHLAQYAIFALAGGFSYGDDIRSGKILAVELTSYLSDQLQSFTDSGKPIIGVCNGFQVLTQTGLLPGKMGEQKATLAENDIGRFNCRWIELAVGESACKFVKPEDFLEQPIPMQVAHAEGKFVCSQEELTQLKAGGQIVLRYSTPDLQEPTGYPDNPNGALDNIAGICDAKGVVLGMMPHPERSVEAFHPHRIRTAAARQAAMAIFNRYVEYARQM